ncbi:MAG: hypothetical protein ACE5PV_20575, partial [Candidatus Poribacteria bacterium]
WRRFSRAYQRRVDIRLVFRRKPQASVNGVNCKPKASVSEANTFVSGFAQSPGIPEFLEGWKDGRKKMPKSLPRRFILKKAGNKVILIKGIYRNRVFPKNSVRAIMRDEPISDEEMLMQVMTHLKLP